MQGYAAFNARMKMCESHPACGRLSFSDFVAKPLQRLTKYPLLLKGILKTTDDKSKVEIAALTKVHLNAVYLP